ncbi:MAG: aminotransferase class I/II-fold pyridoxal phosphate-dependent enzyme [Heliobacteriaceae bacterium]|jgi:arginine/lysine/ornithine decarboxylase|nr:aminotransferase class I/II-fold pyridoxal phosphate-dependent enzyme [Heliobacteriaceae bacterium]
MNKKTKEIIRAPIVEALKNACENPTYQFHIPGHTKGGCVLPEFRALIGNKALCVDTTDEFDNLGTLHPATGPVKEAQELAAKAFRAKRTFFLLNGSTAGNLAFGMGLTRQGQKIITNRNCHRSILTGLIISGAEPLWLTPNRLEEWGLWGSVDPANLEEMLENNDDVGLVWITNPTYEGVMSDVKTIAAVCKKYQVPLVVDEAHACLWNFSENLPTPALQFGADAVIHSLHKTGGSMSQSSMLHIAHDSLISTVTVEKALKLLQTTSPSMLLLASLDAARANLESVSGRKQIECAVSNAKYLRREIDKLKHIHHLQPASGYETDVTKVFIKADGLSGVQLESILEIDFGIEVESASDIGLLILSNIGNSKKDIEYLVKCLKKIDKSHYIGIHEDKKFMPMLEPVIKMSLREAFFCAKETVPKSEAVGRVAAEVIAECPPGIAVLLPGELITEEHLPYLVDYGFIEVVD